MIFEPSDGASPASLRHFLAKVFDIPLNRLHVAKYFRAKYDWMVIRDTPPKQVIYCFCIVSDCSMFILVNLSDKIVYQ